MYTFHIMAPKKHRWELFALLQAVPNLTAYTELTGATDTEESPIATTVVAGVSGLVSSLEAVDQWARTHVEVLIITAKGTKLWLGGGQDTNRRDVFEDWPLRWG